MFSSHQSIIELFVLGFHRYILSRDKLDALLLTIEYYKEIFVVIHERFIRKYICFPFMKVYAELVILDVRTCS